MYQYRFLTCGKDEKIVVCRLSEQVMLSKILSSIWSERPNTANAYLSGPSRVCQEGLLADNRSQQLWDRSHGDFWGPSTHIFWGSHRNGRWPKLSHRFKGISAGETFQGLPEMTCEFWADDYFVRIVGDQMKKASHQTTIEYYEKGKKSKMSS